MDAQPVRRGRPNDSGAHAGVTDRDLTVHLRHATPAMSHRYSRRAVAWVAAERVADELLRGRVAG